MGFAFETTTIGWLTIVVGWVLATLALISVVLYIWSKTVDGRPWWNVDDVLLYLSLFLSLVLMAVTTWAVVAEGQGRHQPTESRSQFELIAKSLLVNEILWGVVNTFLRICAILFLRKVFVTRFMNAITNVLLFLSVAYGAAVIATSLAICQPISAGWDQDTVAGKCGNEIAAYLCLEIIAAVLDLAITGVPLPPLAGLRVPPRKKLTAYVLFSLGSVVFIITGLRIAALNRVNSHDFSYDRGYIGFLSILGPLIAIICCCATASAGPVYRIIRNWARSQGFSSSMVVWSRGSRGTRRWTPAAVTRSNRNTEPRSGVLEMEEPLESESTFQAPEVGASAGSPVSTTEQPGSFTESREDLPFEQPVRPADWV